jgi:hypothetical protein
MIHKTFYHRSQPGINWKFTIFEKILNGELVFMPATPIPIWISTNVSKNEQDMIYGSKAKDSNQNIVYYKDPLKLETD